MPPSRPWIPLHKPLFHLFRPFSVPQRRLRLSASAASVVKAEFRRSKPHFNVGTIGHVDHGKTSLTSAITKVLSASGLASFTPYEKIDNCPDERRRGITINARHVEYETRNRHYSHVDCPGHIDFIKNMITGSFVTDGCVLVLAANAGVMPQTREHIILARQIGLDKLIVFVNKADLVDESTTQLCEDEIREMLQDYGFDGAQTPVITGSAKMALEKEEEEDEADAALIGATTAADGVTYNKTDLTFNHESDFDRSRLGRSSILKLLRTMDEYFELPSRKDDVPSLLSICETYSIVGRGTVVSGILEKGVVKKGDAVEILGYDLIYKSVVASIETFHKSLSSPLPGDNIGVLVRGVKRSQLRRGMVLAKAGSAGIVNRVKARVYLLESDEGGLDEPLCQDHQLKLFSRTANVMTNVNRVLWERERRDDGASGVNDSALKCGDDDIFGGEIDGDRQMVMPGEEATLELMLMRKLYLPVGSRFTFRTKMLTIGYGVVTEVLSDADETMLKRRWRRWKIATKR